MNQEKNDHKGRGPDLAFAFCAIYRQNWCRDIILETKTVDENTENTGYINNLRLINCKICKKEGYKEGFCRNLV